MIERKVDPNFLICGDANPANYCSQRFALSSWRQLSRVRRQKDKNKRIEYIYKCVSFLQSNNFHVSGKKKHKGGFLLLTQTREK